MKTIVGCVIVSAIVVTLGCADATDAPVAVAPTSPQVGAPPPPAPPPPVQPGASGGETASAESAETSEADTERVKAEVGVGKRGRDYGGSYITEVVKARFTIEQRLVFDQVQHALQLYQAANGRLPKSHEEFMREIIAANQIALPELPEGERYVYDPKLGELMVERAAK